MCLSYGNIEKNLDPLQFSFKKKGVKKKKLFFCFPSFSPYLAIKNQIKPHCSSLMMAQHIKKNEQIDSFGFLKLLYCRGRVDLPHCVIEIMNNNTMAKSQPLTVSSRNLQKSMFLQFYYFLHFPSYYIFIHIYIYSDDSLPMSIFKFFEFRDA